MKERRRGGGGGDVYLVCMAFEYDGLEFAEIIVYRGLGHWNRSSIGVEGLHRIKLIAKSVRTVSGRLIFALGHTGIVLPLADGTTRYISRGTLSRLSAETARPPRAGPHRYKSGNTGRVLFARQIEISERS